MSTTTNLLLTHPYAVLFAVVLVEQLGLPVPAVPFLLAAGAVTAAGSGSLGAFGATAVAAALAADLAWFSLGSRRGASVLSAICRFSPQPGACPDRARHFLLRQGSALLLWMKFVPGLSLVATPLAGVSGMPLSRFLPLDLAGSFLWAGSYLSLGFFFGAEIAHVLSPVLGFGRSVAEILAGVLVLAALWKLVQRRARPVASAS